MAADLIRVLSDLHYGDRSSRIRRLSQLQPLADGARAVILNGDTLDMRRGPDPAYTAACRSEVEAFFAGWGPPVRFLTGNHDPDFSPDHALDLADGQIWALHGDIVFDEIVPWGRDAAHIRRELHSAWASSGLPGRPAALSAQFESFRSVAAAVAQRHQAERNGWKYLARFAADTVWPPWRMLRVLRTWQVYPSRIRALARLHRPAARFALVGHTHRPGVSVRAGGPIVINTGSFCRPFGGQVVDVTPGALTVRKLRFRGGQFYPGEAVAQFALRPPAAPPR